jgi:chemotaxis receptor (MCP) glutamine deamidase CheD
VCGCLKQDEGLSSKNGQQIVKLKHQRFVDWVMNRLVKKLEKIGRDPKITAKAVGLCLCVG